MRHATHFFVMVVSLLILQKGVVSDNQLENTDKDAVDTELDFLKLQCHYENKTETTDCKESFIKSTDNIESTETTAKNTLILESRTIILDARVNKNYNIRRKRTDSIQRRQRETVQDSRTPGETRRSERDFRRNRARTDTRTEHENSRRLNEVRNTSNKSLQQQSRRRVETRETLNRRTAEVRRTEEIRESAAFVERHSTVTHDARRQRQETTEFSREARNNVGVRNTRRSIRRDENSRRTVTSTHPSAIRRRQQSISLRRNEMVRVRNKSQQNASERQRRTLERRITDDQNDITVFPKSDVFSTRQRERDNRQRSVSRNRDVSPTTSINLINTNRRTVNDRLATNKFKESSKERTMSKFRDNRIQNSDQTRVISFDRYSTEEPLSYRRENSRRTNDQIRNNRQERQTRARREVRDKRETQDDLALLPAVSRSLERYTLSAKERRNALNFNRDNRRSSQERRMRSDTVSNRNNII